MACKRSGVQIPYPPLLIERRYLIPPICGCDIKSWNLARSQQLALQATQKGAMTTNLPDDLRQAIEKEGGSPVHIVDAATMRTTC